MILIEKNSDFVTLINLFTVDQSKQKKTCKYVDRYYLAK